MYAGHSFDWCITNEANHQGHHSCDNSASKRDTYQSNTQVQEVYYGYSQETHRDPQGNNSWKLPTQLPNKYYYQPLLSSITELQTETSKQTNKQTITFRINHQQQFQDYQALQPFRNKFSGTTLGICLSVKQENNQENKTNIRSHPPHFRESATWHGHLVKPTGQG